MEAFKEGSGFQEPMNEGRGGISGGVTEARRYESTGWVWLSTMSGLRETSLHLI